MQISRVVNYINTIRDIIKIYQVLNYISSIIFYCDYLDWECIYEYVILEIDNIIIM